MNLTIFDKNKRASGYFSGEIDMEIGDSTTSNDFETDDTLFMGACIAEIGGEFGGIVERYDDGSEKKYTGYTWRGLMDKWLILPPDGEDRLTMSGDINVVIRRVLRGVLGDFFVVDDTILGVLVWYYSFPLYCTVLEGLTKLCEDHGCKLVIRNEVEDKKLKVVVTAKRAEHKTPSESLYDASVTVSKMGINHLLCLGKGELQERLRTHLYLWPDGTIKQNTPYYTGFEERQATYENTAEEDLTELIKGGTERLKELASFEKMELQSAYVEADVGDFLKATKDGMSVEQPVVRKILSGNNGNYSIEVKIRGENDE